MLDLFYRGQERRIDLMQAAAEPGKRSDVCIECGATQVLEQVVMNVYSVQSGVTGQGLVQVREVVVDEVGKRLRWVYAQSCLALGLAAWRALIQPMVQ
jgi:hypothetical protein